MIEFRCASAPARSTPPHRRGAGRGAVLPRVAAGVSALALALGLLAPAPAQASPQDPALAEALAAALEDPRVQDGTTALQVLDEADGTVLFDQGGSTPLIPASNTKLLTGAAALDTLGRAYRFHTDALAAGSVSRTGVLRGDLVLKGHGDPTTLERDYQALAEAVADAGVTTVTGDLLADDTFFEQQAFNSFWNPEDASSYYSAEISALTLAPNTDYDSGTVIIETTPGDRGEPAEVEVVPASAAGYVDIDNQTTTTGAGSTGGVEAERTPDTNEVVLTGDVPRGSGTDQTWVTVDQPELLAATVFGEALAAEGVRVRGEVAEGTAPDDAELLARDRSMTLSNLMVPFMKLSNNMHAETLLKTMSAEPGSPGSWSEGVEEVQRFLVASEVEVEGLSLVDGSGLARANRIPATTLTSALRAFTEEDWFDVYQASLPLAGNDERFVGGTLRTRMVDTPAANNLRGKTGSLTGVTALSGYVTGADGRDYVFSMLSNYDGDTPRPVEDEVGATLAGWEGPDQD